MNTDKLSTLTARSKDKTLPRDVRRQAAIDLEWEKFRLDKRPVMTLKKSKSYELISSLSTTLCMGWISIAEYLGIKGSRINTFIFPFVLLFMVISLVLTTSKAGKFKTEPADDLARTDLLKASNIAFLTLFSIALLLLFTMTLLSGFDENKGITISWYNLIFVLCFVQGLHSFLKNLFFLYLEKDISDSESEEEE